MFHGDLLGERARLTPERLALVVIETGERLTYGELDARCTRAMAALRAAGVQRGDRYGLLAHNSVEFLELFFAAAKGGSIVVPLSTRATAHELESIVRDSGMSVLFYGPEFRETAESCRATLAAPALAVPIVPEPADSVSWPALKRSAEPVAAVRPDPEDLFCLLYTSGTTGKPKGVMIPHRMVVWNGYNTAVCWDLHQDDVSPVFTPLYHAGGLGAFLLPIFTIGGTIVLHRQFNPSEVWQTIEREGCSVVLGVPTIWKILMEAPEFATVDLSSVRWLISGGAPLPLYLIEAYQKRGVVFKQGFGMTEVGVNCFSMTVDDSFRKRGSIGRPMMYTEAKLVSESGAEVPTGEVGELWLKGPHVSSGYWQNEEATRQAYGEDGFFRTGDLARKDDDGFFTIAGRRKEMFISGGVNIYPAEIEGALVTHPAVSDAAVVGIADETWGEVAAAFLVLVPGQSTTVDELNAFLGERLAKYKLPKRYRFLDTLPRTPYGKVVKAELAKML